MWWVLVFFFLVTILPTTNGEDHIHNEHNENPRNHRLGIFLKLRHQILARFAENSHPIRSHACSQDQFLFITEYPFGRAGNNLIELTHGLWLSEQLNTTLVIPPWMAEVLIPFNTSILSSHYCYTFRNPTSSQIVKKYELTSEDSFFLFKIFNKNSPFSAFLPSFTVAVSQLSRAFLHIYASLWSSPLPSILEAAEVIINDHLDGHFGYSAVHKRQLEGGCAKIFHQNTKPSDFSPLELPMNHQEWLVHLGHHHPLCEMTYSFVKATMDLHHRNNSKIFVAYDGRGNVNDYIEHGGIFSSVLDKSAEFKNMRSDRKFVDMLLAIHSDFFMLNPRSTFSWQIYLVRLVLALPSVPILRNNDFYMQKVPDELQASGREGLWVSSTSTIAALLDVNQVEIR